MITGTFWWTFAAATIAMVVTTIGIFVINKYASWGKRKVVYFAAFAAGVLISVSFLHIIPESIEMSPYAPVGILVGFLVLHLINKFWNSFVCGHDEKCEHSLEGMIPAIGIGFHSFIDGIIYSVTFNVSVFTGVLAAIGLVMHEFPEGVVTYILLHKGGLSKGKSAFYAFLAAAITTPLGMLVSWPFIATLKGTSLGFLLALSAGALVYVGATHLLPEVEKENKMSTLLAMAAGIAVAVVIVMGH
ncbi:ZIP family metal transporter [Candidatus Woesearchaeota archaeon]|nr:ZIP family metal transporter [Candidatus Woesearchaeota archaeon]